MVIGIKYCGGCNCRYNREAAVNIFCQRLKDKAQIEYARPEREYDFLLVVCGCQRACADYVKLRARKYLVAVSEDMVRMAAELAME